MENKMSSLMQTSNYCRFRVFQEKKDAQGEWGQTKTVGMAYLAAGQSIYTIRLWTLAGERYYLLPNKADPAKYFIMTRELNRKLNASKKYFWNIVGNAQVNSSRGFVEMEFDILSRPIFMNISPEREAYSSMLPEPEIDIAA